MSVPRGNLVSVARPCGCVCWLVWSLKYDRRKSFLAHVEFCGGQITKHHNPTMYAKLIAECGK